MSDLPKDSKQGSDNPDSFVGTLLANRYYIEAKVAKGGTAVVYRARDQTLDREVAVKILHEHLENRKEVVMRLQREAKVIAQIRHPNILTVHDFLDIGGRAVLVVEFMPGQTLSALIQMKEEIPEDIILMISYKVLLGLQAAHELEITHRDIKPANILIHGDLGIKISDFGLAKIINSAEDGLTKVGVFIGTPSFSSPEQIEGKPLDHRSDIFSLGLTVYMMATKAHAFKNRGDSTSTVWLKTVKGHFEAARLRNPKISKELDRVISKALMVDLSKRYQTSREMAEDIEKILRQRDLLPYDSRLKAYFDGPSLYQSSIVRRRFKLRRMTLAAGFLVTTLFGAWYLWQSGSAPNETKRFEELSSRTTVPAPAQPPALEPPSLPAQIQTPVEAPIHEQSPRQPLQIRPLEDSPAAKPARKIDAPSLPKKAPFEIRPDAVDIQDGNRVIISDSLEDYSLKISWQESDRFFELRNSANNRVVEQGTSLHSYWMTRPLQPGAYDWKTSSQQGRFTVERWASFAEETQKTKSFLVVTTQFADVEAEINPWSQILRFSWLSGPSAETYRLELSPESSFLPILFQGTSTTKYLSVERAWAERETLYWRVAFMDEAKNVFFVDRPRRLNLVARGFPPVVAFENSSQGRWPDEGLNVSLPEKSKMICHFRGRSGPLGPAVEVVGVHQTVKAPSKDFQVAACSVNRNLYLLH